MNAEKEKMERLSGFLRFIDLMVRQACRRANYDTQTRNRIIKDDKESLYAFEHLKKFYEKPRDCIFHLLKNPQRTLKGLRVESACPAPKKDTKYTRIEQKLLLDFVRKVQEQYSRLHIVWIDLQHYLYYSYRNFASQSPKATTETLSAFFVCEMKELIDCLRRDDESQVWLRIFTLLREYCIFAQWHYSQNDKEEALKKFFAYYEAMLTAAKALLPVFADFERDFLYKNYKVCWIDFNSFIFVRYFYESDRVKPKIDEYMRIKKSPGDPQQMFVSMHKLKRMWHDHHSKISLLNQEGKLTLDSNELLRERRALTIHKKLLAATFWVDRSKDIKKTIDVNRLDHHLFDLLKDKNFFPEGPGLNKTGQCICEECLIMKYKMYLEANENYSIIATDERSTFCRKCRCILNLEQFQRHVNSHADDMQKETAGKASNLSRILSDKIDMLGLTPSSKQLNEMFSEKLKISENIINHMEKNKVKKSDVASAKAAFEKFLQARKEPKVDKLRAPISPCLREELLLNSLEHAMKDERCKITFGYVTPEKLTETQLALRELRKKGHKPAMHDDLHQSNESTASAYAPQTDESNQQKKCDCTYCEIFQVQKTLEPTDNNSHRMRLYRRRERRTEVESVEVPPDGDHNKIESRVPLPPSPAHVPSIADPTPFDYPFMSSSNNEIRGLVNYIEGNRARNKAELAQKKAAKKARQREKKEQEKMQLELEAQRKLEEEAILEEERQMMLQKEQEYLDEQLKLQEAKLKKQLKKQRQALKRQEIAMQKRAIEETIPAMVTIKRIPGADNVAPSVTITIKGCTPDQDKLLTTLVEEPPKVDTKNTAKAEAIASNKTAVANKKKKNAVAKGPVETAALAAAEPKVLAKDVKVTLALDNHPSLTLPSSVDVIADTQPKKKIEREPTNDEIKALGNLKLPPGITITKIDGPISSKPYSPPSYSGDSAKTSSILNKSGVIVVDTEKLIQKTENDNKAKKKKKKNKKIIAEIEQSCDTKEKPKMVTLRNPLFHQFQAQNPPKPSMSLMTDEPAPAAIFTSGNGMVTIRSSRLQKSLENGVGRPANGSPMGLTFMPDLMSDYPSARADSINGGATVLKEQANAAAPLDAQEILSGLPGIEITKIDKKNDKVEDMDIDNSCRGAQVSIIPSNGSEFDLEFDKDDDWIYDNVFKPRDVLEDDMDDEELELEAFKRFCQQSVPPKEKKVAHFNVADIVVKKKVK